MAVWIKVSFLYGTSKRLWWKVDKCVIYTGKYTAHNPGSSFGCILGSNPNKYNKFFSFPERPDRPWGPLWLVNRYLGFF
jgi:hypothetical protein